MNNDEIVLGFISKRDDVQEWLKAVPRCGKCKFPIRVGYSGLRSEYAWPSCSNRECVYSHDPHTFTRID